MTIYFVGGGTYTPPPPPPPKPATYKVQPGDSLESIAQTHHTTVQALAQLNHLDLEHPHATVISTGQELQLPQPSADTDQSADDPVTKALSNYEQVATNTRNSEILAAHTGGNPGDPGLQLNLDQAQTQLNQALEFQAAANQRAGQPSDPNEINTLVQHYGGLAQFANNNYAQSGLSNAASNLNSPQAAAVDKIFSQVTAPMANNSNLGTRENQFANALANQPADVVAAVRNDPRYQPLLNQFVNATVGNSTTPPQLGSDPQTVASWENQAQQNLSDLADMVNGRPGMYNGLPPSIAADVVKMPEVQQLISGVLTTNAPVGAPANALSQEQLETWLGRNFQSMSRIADSLGSNTPAANQFTQQTAGEIVAALQTAGIPSSAYSQYLNIQNELGAPPTDVNTQASPALAIAIAQQVQANGDSKDAQGIISDVCAAVNNVATSNGSYTTSVTQALSDYQSKTADLNWMIANLGQGASAQQINAAAQAYISKQSASWQNAYNQDKVTLQNSGQFLANDITQLENLPASLKTSQVNSTLQSLAGNPAVQQALGYALQNKPLSVLGSDGSQANALTQFLKLAKTDKGAAQGAMNLASAIAQTYAQTQLEPKLLSNLSNLTPGTAEYTTAVQGTLKDFAQQNPALADLIGLNDKNINSLSNLFDGQTPSEDQQAAINAVAGKLQGFSRSQPILKGLALAIGAGGLIQAILKAGANPNAGNIFGVCTNALGFAQNAASFAKLFNKVNPSNPFIAFGSGSSPAGELAGKLLNSIGIVTNLESLGSDIGDGNTLGAVNTGMSLAGSALQSDALEGILVDLGASPVTTSGYLDPLADTMVFGSALISVGQMFFTGGAHPPSISDQESFLQNLGYGGLSQKAITSLLPETSNNPNLSTPGSSPLMLLTKYAQDKGYNLQDANQRAAFVNWLNQLAATPDANNYNHVVNMSDQPYSQLDSLVQNLDAELDYTKGDINNFGSTSSSDQAFTQAMNQLGDLSDTITNLGTEGVTNNPFNNDHVVTVAPRSGDTDVVAPQSAYQIDQLLKLIEANGLPAAPPSAHS